MPGDSRLEHLHAEKVTGNSPSMDEVGLLQVDSLHAEAEEGLCAMPSLGSASRGNQEGGGEVRREKTKLSLTAGVS